jgi:hypothetical protein
VIDVTSNIAEVIGIKLGKIRELKQNPDPVLRTVALAVLPELVVRVHQKGKDAEGGQIGTYSPGYMKVRTGNYPGTQLKRGANKGNFRDKKTAGQAGVFTKGDKKGSPRPVYNRSSDTTVILSLTRQMENDTSVIDTETGYGIGYINPDNFKKAMYCEETYNKKILSKLTKEEEEIAYKAADNFTADYLKTE